MNEYKGIIIEESLENNLIINELKIIKVQISEKLKWHMYDVLVDESDIQKLSELIKPKWYMHLWKDKKVIVIFKNKEFELDYDNKDSWDSAIKYGLSLGIPLEQLDFPIS
ncbi:MAG: hypothetical protein ABH840_00625 [Nanoarchaeota archaeon]